MATGYLTRAVVSKTRPLNAILAHSYNTAAAAAAFVSRPALVLRLRPLVAAASAFNTRLLKPVISTRGFATRQTASSLNDQNPNWSNRPPKETILLDGCDFEHWLVVVEPPPENATRDEIIGSYIKTLATVIGSEDEARMKIYSVSTRCYFAFGALVSEELSYKIKELPNVRWVLPDSYLDVKNKDYGGEPFIDGQAVPYDPKYHEEWIRNNSRANERNRRNDRPRNYDRSRNFERRREMNNNYNFSNNNSNMGRPQNPNSPSALPPLNPPPNAGGMNGEQGSYGVVTPPPNNNPSNFQPRGPPPPNNNAPNHQYGPPGGLPGGPPGGPPGALSGGPPGVSPGGLPGGLPGGSQGDFAPGMRPGQGQNQSNTYVPPNPGGGNHYQNQNAPTQPWNRGFGPGPGPSHITGGFGPSAGFGPGPSQNTGGFGPSAGLGSGPNQNTGGFGPSAGFGPGPNQNTGGFGPNAGFGPGPGQNQNNYGPNHSGYGPPVQGPNPGGYGNSQQNQNVPGRD